VTTGKDIQAFIETKENNHECNCNPHLYNTSANILTAVTVLFIAAVLAASAPLIPPPRVDRLLDHRHGAVHAGGSAGPP
jgi:hypothetical protein